MQIFPLAASEDFQLPEPLLAARPQQPYACYRGLVSEEALRRFSLRRAVERLKDADASTVLAREGEAVAGLACWRRLSWDSEQFGLAAGALEVLLYQGDYREAREGKAALIREVLDDCRRRGIRHLTARVDAGDFSTIHVLEGAGFEIVDGIQTFSIRVVDAPLQAARNGLEVRAFRNTDLEQVLSIARSAYIYDRFHADPALSSEVADAVNVEWVRNCCLGSVADGVVVAAQAGTVLGYVTCKVDREAADDLGVCFGTIVLVATAEEARGRGVARQATLGALEWFRGQGVAVVEVGTQLRNIPAARLYESCGFRLVGVTLTLRRLL